MTVDKSTPFWNADLPAEERIGWLLKNTTIEEKLSLIAGGGRADLPRLGIPGVGVGGEAAHGVRARNDQGPVEMRRPPEPTTSFVQPIGMSATWDPELLRQAGEVTGVEARVIHHRHPGRGLSRWAPTVDIERDPRWGRNEEAYGEDPFLTGEMASGYVRGMQGENERYLRVAATLKHFYANNTERGRVWKNSSVDPRNRYELYLEPFRRVIQTGGAEAIMTAYNRINGMPGILNPEVKDILKKQYGLRHAVGDGGAMGLVVTHAHTYGMHAETVANAIKAGVDSMSDNPAIVYPAAKEAYELGLLTEEEIDTAIANVLCTKLRLGVYDAENHNPFDQVTEADMCCKKHQDICHQVSREAVVLLENDGMLPLRDVQAADVALIGPLADAWHQDWYGGEPTFRTTLKQGFAQLLGDVACCDGHDRVTFSVSGKYLCLDGQGNACLGDTPEVFIKEDWGEGSYNFRSTTSGKYLAIEPEDVAVGVSAVMARNKAVFSWHIEEVFRMEPQADGTLTLSSRFDTPLALDENDHLVTGEGLTAARFTMTVVENGVEAAVRLAQQKKIVILALGCQPMVNAKEEHDRETIDLPPYQQKLMDAITAANANTALVLFSNYPYAFRTDARAAVWSATGAQDMGLAMAETLLGANAPAGRLNMTWYQSDDQLPSIDDYDIIKGKRTYRYFDGAVQYPFGHGLTYTSFAYNNMEANLEEDGLHVSFEVTNTGHTTSDEVAQVYATAPASRVKKPLKQLVGFERLKGVTPGETRQVCIQVPVEELRFYDVISRKLMVEAGCYTLAAGRSSAELPLAVQVDVPGEKPGMRDVQARIAADHYDDYENMLLTAGQYGFAAAAVADEQQAGSLTYRDVEPSTLTDKLVCHLMSAQGCRVEVLLNGQPAGSWQGSTVDYNPQPFKLQDNKNRADEVLRISLQQPIYANVEIPLKKADQQGLTELTLRLTGDAKLCWFRCVKE